MNFTKEQAIELYSVLSEIIEDYSGFRSELSFAQFSLIFDLRTKLQINRLVPYEVCLAQEMKEKRQMDEWFDDFEKWVNELSKK